GSQTVLSNVTTYQPAKSHIYRVILERFMRDNGNANRGGLGINWQLSENLWVDAQGLKSSDEDILASRYEADLVWRVHNRPGTLLTLGGKYFSATEDHAKALKLGVEQALNDKWSLGYEHLRVNPANSSDTSTNIFRVMYHEEDKRHVNLSYAIGGE